MAWKLKGHYVSACSCTNVCPCPTGSAPPDNPDGTTNCWGSGIWDVSEGNLDELDLSGTRFAIQVNFPDIVTSGMWRLGIVVDPGASDDQAKALEQILSGQLGGPFGEMSPLVAEFSAERGELVYSPTGVSVAGGSFTYEPLRGADGSPTTVKNAALGFAPEFEIGTASGTLQVLGHTAPASYGEAADFEYASASHEHVRA